MAVLTAQRPSITAPSKRSRALVLLRGRLSQQLRMLRWLHHGQIRHARRQAPGAVVDATTATAIQHMEAAMAALTRLGNFGSARGQVHFKR
jgi:hypothetical protein